MTASPTRRGRGNCCVRSCLGRDTVRISRTLCCREHKVRENCTPGSVWGASGNRRPYRDEGRHDEAREACRWGIATYCRQRGSADRNWRTRSLCRHNRAILGTASYGTHNNASSRPPRGTSTKPGNVTLNMRKLAVAIASGALTITGAIATPWTLLLGALVTWDSLWSCLQLDLGEIEAS